MRLVIALIVIISVTLCKADYACLCSYNEELNVYASDDTSAKVLGSMYEFDCKPTYGQTSNNDTFQPIQFENQVGYIKKQETVVQTCLGNIPKADLVILTTTQTITTEQQSMTTTSQARTTTLQASTSQVKTTTLQGKTTTSQAETTTLKASPSSEVVTTQRSSTKVTTTPVATTLTTAAKSTTESSTHSVPSVVWRCPDHWIRHDESCYFVVLDHRLRYKDASDACIRLDSHLVFINSSPEQNYVQTTLEGLFAYRNSGRGEVWMGGIDTVTEGSWKWTDPLINSATPFNYTNWDRHQPDGHGKHDEDCVALAGVNHYKWHDLPCSSNLKYICERTAYINHHSSVIIG